AGGRAVVALDGADTVQPDSGGLVGDRGTARLSGGLGRPDRVHVQLGALERVVDLLAGVGGRVGRAAGRRRGWGAGGGAGGGAGRGGGGGRAGALPPPLRHPHWR